MNAPDITYKIEWVPGRYLVGWWTVYVAVDSWWPWHVEGYRWKELAGFAALVDAKEFVEKCPGEPRYYDARGRRVVVSDDGQSNVDGGGVA